MDDTIARALGLMAQRGAGAGGLVESRPPMEVPPDWMSLLGRTPGVQHTLTQPQLGGGPLAPARMPQLAQPTGDQPLSLWQRIKRGLGSARDGLMPVPQGLEGLLAPDDVARARKQGLLQMGLSLLGNAHGQGGHNAPSLGQALGQGLGAAQQSFGQGVGDAVQGHQLGMQMKQMQQRAALQKKLQEQYPNFARMSPEQQSQAITGIFGEMLSNGMYDEAGKVASVIPGMQGAKGKLPQWEDFGGYKALMTPDGRELQRVSKTPSPKDPNAPNHAQELSEQRMFQREQQLADDFRSATKQHADVAGMIGVMEASADAALAGDPAAQQSMIYGIMKLNDPGSSVKEGEYATAQNAQGWGEKARNEYNAILHGTTLDKAAVQRYIGQSKRLKTTWQRKFNAISGVYQRRAKAWQVNPANVTIDYFAGGAPTAPVAAAPSGPNPLLQTP